MSYGPETVSQHARYSCLDISLTYGTSSDLSVHALQAATSLLVTNFVCLEVQLSFFLLTWST